MAGSLLSSKAGYDKYLKGLQSPTQLLVKVAGASKPSLLKQKLTGRGWEIVETLNVGDKVLYVPELNPTNSSVYKVYKVGDDLPMIYGIRYNHIVKPVKEPKPNLKPVNIFRGREHFRNHDDLAYATWEGIQSLNVGIETTEYLKLLIGITNKKFARDVCKSNEYAIKREIKTNWTAWKGVVPIGSIASDFGEVLGALWVIDSKLSKHLGDSAYQISDIMFPKDSRYPLIDYLINYKKHGEIVQRKYSAKSAVASSANTVKLTTILDEIETWRDKKDFYEVHKNNWVLHLCEFGKALKNKNFKAVEINEQLQNWYLETLQNGELEMGKPDYDPKASVKSFWTAVSNASGNQEKIKSFFLDFAKDSIFYVILNIDANGLPMFYMDLSMLHRSQVFLKELREQLGFNIHFNTKMLIDR